MGLQNADCFINMLAELSNIFGWGVVLGTTVQDKAKLSTMRHSFQTQSGRSFAILMDLSCEM
jgi:hypothetical protein